MAYKLIITEKTEGLLDNLVYHVPDKGNFCICNRDFPSIRELQRESVTVVSAGSKNTAQCFSDDLKRNSRKEP